MSRVIHGRAGRLLGVLALLTSLGACRVIDVRVDPHLTGVNSDALIEGYATVGFADDPSLLRVDVLDGRSAGSVLFFELWYLLRFELGLLGASLGVGPFDVGIGTLFYHPRSPAAPPIQPNRWRLEAPHAEGWHVHVHRGRQGGGDQVTQDPDDAADAGEDPGDGAPGGTEDPGGADDVHAPGEGGGQGDP